MKQIIFILVAGIVLAGCSSQSKVPKTNIFTDYSKPWFKGRETTIVCKKPYSSDSDCYTLDVYSDGEYIDVIYFPNWGHIEAVDSECAEAASFYNFEQFCTVWDKEDNQWDIM